MAEKWVLSWARIAFVPMGGRNIQPRLERKTFDSQKEAINFAMSLDYAQRRTVQLHMPDGDVAYPPSIEQMHATYQEGN